MADDGTVGVAPGSRLDQLARLGATLAAQVRALGARYSLQMKTLLAKYGAEDAALAWNLRQATALNYGTGGMPTFVPLVLAAADLALLAALAAGIVTFAAILAFTSEHVPSVDLGDLIDIMRSVRNHVFLGLDLSAEDVVRGYLIARARAWEPEYVSVCTYEFDKAQRHEKPQQVRIGWLTYIRDDVPLDEGAVPAQVRIEAGDGGWYLTPSGHRGSRISMRRWLSEGRSATAVAVPIRRLPI